MLNLVSITLIFLSLTTSVYCNPKRYDNYKVFRIVPTTDKQVEMLRQFGKMKGNSFWVEPSEWNPVDLQIAPPYLNKFYKMAPKIGMQPQIFINNIQQLIDDERTMFENHAGGSFRVYKIVAGETYQKRLIQGVRLRFGLQKPGIFIEGGMHGREWISPATVVYLIDRLLNSQDAAVREMAESYDWYIFPVCNPDGYVYSQQFDRLWQKTVSDTGMGSNPPDPDCKGVDLNRNFDYKWQNQEQRDTDPCHERYAGRYAFSEIESKALSEYIKTLRGKLLAYLSIHSYTQFLLLPYDYTSQHLENYHDAYTIGVNAIAALTNKFGTPYRIGNRAELTNGLVSGTAMDWAKGSMKLELAFTYKLRNSKEFGFLLPEKYIASSSEEFITSLVTMFQYARTLDYPKDKRIGKCYFPAQEGSSSCTGKGKLKLPRCFFGGGR